MTYRDRRAARADRLRGWADKRSAKASARFAAVDRIADGIPFGQPILVGHHSEGRARRDASRIDSGMRAGFADSAKAADMRSRADNIDAAAAIAIYSDDDDAVDRLTAKIADLVAKRDRIAAFNASCRKAAKTGGTGDFSLLDDAMRANWDVVNKYTHYNIGPGGALPSYASSNLSGNISRLRARLASLTKA